MPQGFLACANLHPVAYLQSVHITLAAVTLCGFLVRGYWMLQNSPQRHKPWVHIMPHVIDTALFLSGLGLVISLRLYPTDQPWLAAKLLAVVVYIVLGSFALKRGQTRPVRAMAMVAALLVFGYVVSVALTHRVVPIPF